MQAAAKWFQRIGPYLVVAIVMPGGFVVAPVLYMLRRYRGG